jgi:malate dehydrogenase (oxaloacetate-decarboxylating)(NADP+)
MIRRGEALAYHGGARPGKIEIRATKPCLDAREMRLAYLPGATFPSAAIVEDPEAVFRYTARANLVGVLSNGSAVPGLGAVGPAAVKPMLEGMAVLFKRLADIDVFDLELDTRDADRFVDVVRALEPSFGGIVLKDLRAPEGLVIYERLCETLGIPVLHENLHSTAVVAAAALLNAIDLAGKDLPAAQVVVWGAGTVGIGCARLLLHMGVAPDRLLVYDARGLLHPDRDDLSPYQRALARAHPAGTLEQGLRDADVFLGASTGAVLRPEAIRAMARFPIVIALGTPDPEIPYETARSSRKDVIVATSAANAPNAIVDHLAFPYIVRGALDVHATRITERMLFAAARALADLAREEVVEEVDRVYRHERLGFGPEYLLPKPIDPRLLVRQSSAVARQAVLDGVARLPLDQPRYEESLRARMGTGRETMRRLVLKARQECPRVVFSEGTSEVVIRACGILADDGMARPILLGPEPEVRATLERLGIDPGGLTVVDPARSPCREPYAEQYFQMRRRRGVMRASAVERVTQPEYFGAMMLHSGDADLLVSGLGSHYADSLRVVLEVVGTAPGVARVSSHYMVLLPREVYFLADCAVNIDPDAETLAETALLTAAHVRALGIEPRVAMLSFSNFGSVDHPFAVKVREATEIVKRRAPGLAVDGEMQLATALHAGTRHQYFPFCGLRADANVLVFPDLQSGNLAMHLLRHIGDAVVVGPVLMGARLPVHLIQYSSSVEEVVHLTATGVVHAAAARA